MRSVLPLAGAAAIAALTLLASATPSQAQTIYPWCAHYSGRDMGGAANCGFVTFAQCMATVSGIGGFCDVNPWWQGPTPEQFPRARRRAQG